MPFKLAAFNVRTLARIGQQAALARTLESLDVDVCCLSETRIQDSSSIIRLSTSPSSRIFHLRLSGDTEAAVSGQAGVGIALSSRAEPALLEWIPVDSRICAVRLKGSCRKSRFRTETRNLFVVAAYAPTDCSSDAVKDDFYQRLHNLLRSVPRTDIVVLAGDLNARVGRLTSFESHLGGRFGLDCQRTDNGDRLLSLCSEHRLFLVSTNFRHSKRHCATWRPPSSLSSWSQLDHIAVSYSWRGCVQDCRSYWSTCLESDHALVCAKFSMRFGGHPLRNRRRLNVAKLNEPAILSDFQSELAAELTTVRHRDVDEHWEGICKAMQSASSKTCGWTQQTVKHWVSGTSLRLMDHRRSIPAGHEHDETRSRLRRSLVASLKSDREAWWNERAAEMESASAVGDYRKLFHLIRATGKKRLGVSEVICEADGSTIYDLQRRLDRWAEHFQAQFNWPAVQSPPENVASIAPWAVPLEAPTVAEISRVLRALKRYKAAGPDDLAPALSEDGGCALVQELHALFCNIWTEEKVPTVWTESIITPIFKKGRRDVCENHRGISLISVAPKLMSMILLRRLNGKREEQAGFRSGRGCVDQIFTLRQLLEHRHSYHRPTIVVFLDIRAAFDSVDREVLWCCLLRHGVPEKYVSILRALYLHTSGRVRAYGRLSASFSITSGVRQGCPISPFLFNFAIDDVLRRAFDGLVGSGVELLPGSRVTDLDYADDIAVLGDDARVVQQALDRLSIEVSKFGMCFAPSKCKVLLQDWCQPVPSLTIGNDRLDTVDSFVYLGSCISAGGCVEREVSLRLAKAGLAFANLRHLWRRRDVSLATKGRVYNAVVRAVLLYGCETWAIRSEDVRRLSVFDNRCMRSIARVWWQHHVSNADVCQRVLGTRGRTLQDLISLSRLRWLGHVLRMPTHRLPYRALFACPGVGWKKKAGGQPLTWRAGMKKLTKSLGSVGVVRLPGWGPKDHECQWLETLKEMAEKRSQWRQCCLSCLS